MIEVIKIFFLVILQNAAFTLMSRARNSDSIAFNAIASVLSNGLWVIVFRQLALNLDKPVLFITYVIASVIGSTLMHYVSMKWLEKFFKKKPKADKDPVHDMLKPADDEKLKDIKKGDGYYKAGDKK